jgi:hypothetical protein
MTVNSPCFLVGLLACRVSHLSFTLLLKTRSNGPVIKLSSCSKTFSNTSKISCFIGLRDKVHAPAHFRVLAKVASRLRVARIKEPSNDASLGPLAFAMGSSAFELVTTPALHNLYRRAWLEEAIDWRSPLFGQSFCGRSSKSQPLNLSGD